MNVVLLTAAGRSTRMHMDTPKQFIHINGRPVIIHTMTAFQEHPEIDAILVVTLPMWEETIRSYAERYGITKLKWITEGGNTGQESIYNGIKELKKWISLKDVVIIHDGNRPNISQEIISDSLATYREHGSAVAAMPCVEAIFRSKDNVSSADSIPREELFRTQTPHTYELEKLLWAHELAAKRRIQGTTATCVLMQMLGERIYFSKGSDKNIKITTKEDIDIFMAFQLAEFR